ncbi:MAG: hypothetical protein H5T45_01545 [Thermoplasmatales archaeon]|nr:hypothetical protein [Thermoplasmatales archaeon]
MEEDFRIDIISLINDEKEFSDFYIKNEKKIMKIANKMLKLGIYGIVIHPKDDENVKELYGGDVAYR